jgi:hypothetical protein
MRRRTKAVRIVAAVVVTLLIGATIAAAASSIGNDRSGEATTTTTTVELTGAARELASLLDERRTRTYHARYEGSTPEVTSIAIETWQHGTLVRQDQQVQSGSDLLQLSTFVLPTGQVNCVHLGTQGWTCQRAAPGQRQPVDPVGAIRQRLGEGEVTARDANVEGRPVRCFQLTVEGDVSELCVIADSGIPVRITGGTTELRLTVLEEAVDDGVFEPPAPVAG